MDFSLSDKMKKILAGVREFVEKELFSMEKDILARPFTELLPELEKKREKVRSLGLWAPQIPREYGGMGLSLLEHGLVAEQLGRSPLGHFVFNAQAPDSGNMEILLEFGAPEQKKRYLEPLARGEIRSCFSMTEPDYAGSNPVWMGTTAVKEGGVYRINGKKWFTSSADGARFAVVMAVTNPEAEPHERASMIIVPTDTPGFHLVRNTPIMGHTGSGWASHGEIEYRDCRVPVENLLGKEGEGFAIAQARLGPGRIHHCMRWIGVCERVFELMCRRAVTRELAPGDPLGTRQTVQTWIAESRAEINAARLLVLHAAWTIDNVGAKEAQQEISIIKFYAANAMMHVIDRALQVHGGLGVTDDTLVSYYYRNERASRIYDGPDEVHKTVVAKRILKGYRTRMQ